MRIEEEAKTSRLRNKKLEEQGARAAEGRPERRRRPEKD
jgi:hypothetical protein